MARSTSWRKTCNDLVNWRQCEALNATIYILRETGPTGFLLKEDGESKTYKAFLGDPHKCTCPQFKKDKDLCKHICWLILKKFRIPQTNPMTWQLGLVEREINDILRGITAQQQQQRRRTQNTHQRSFGTTAGGDGRPAIQQREIGENDVCPICQDELLEKHLPVTYCKFGCGNSIHIKCMKVWADHQKTSGETVIKCPFCREDFGPIELLNQENRNATGPIQGGRMDRHLGTNCRSCHVSPIEGKCYRCSSCVDFYLCQSCFNTPIHTQHSFEYRHKRNQRWRVAQRTYGAVLPQAVVDDLLNRELSESDYELLTQLDNNATAPKSDIPESVVNSFPMEKIREGSSSMLAPGIQCRICLRSYEIGQLIRKLPRCKHKFHKDCIDNWLLHSHPTCPIDGNVVWDPSMEEAEEEGESRNRSSRPVRTDNSVQQARNLSLEIPGIGIVRQVDSSASQNTTMQNSRRLGRPQRHTANQRQGMSTLRSSFALSGISLGYGNENVSEDTTQISDLPGTRLLGRTQLRRANLSQHLSANNEVRDQDEPSRTGLNSLNGTNVNTGSSISNQADANSLHSGTSNVPAGGNRLELQGNSVLPFDNRTYLPLDQTGGSTSHKAIMSHLALLTEHYADRDPNEDRSSITPHRYQSLRNALLSATEMRSPLRELAPVLESEQENVTVGQTNNNIEQLQYSNVNSDDISQQTFFQRHPTLRFQSEHEDNLSLTSSLASSAVATPDIREPSRKHRLNGDITPPPGQDTSTNVERVIPGVSSAPSVLIRNRVRNDKTVRNRSTTDNRAQRTTSAQNEAQAVNIPTRDQPLSVDSNIMDRLQIFTDLYLGNDPRQQTATTENHRNQTRMPPRPPRRQISNHIAATARRRAQMRPRRRDDISLEGNAYNNLTLRDIMH